jgi:hypothetical protein
MACTYQRQLVSIALCALLFFLRVDVRAQDNDYGLTDGFYLTFEDLRHNRPVTLAAIITKEDVRSQDFMYLVLDADSLRYYDALGDAHAIASEKVWGFCRNGQVHIQTDDDMARIPVLGSISHFTATVVTVTPVSQPFYDPYFGPTNNTVNARSTELRQFVLDMATGRVLPYTEDNVATLLARDAALSAEFDALPARRRKDSLFLFIRRFNAAHPLLFGN